MKTTIVITDLTRDKLKKIGNKGDTYETIIQRLLGD